MGCHRSKAYIYGGICYDSVMNDLIILNLKTMQMSPGSRAPHRRKDHAMTMLNKFMLIHGGL